MEKTKEHLNSFAYRVQQQFIYMLTIGALFSIIGWAVPNLYYHYLDKTEYYSLTQPISINQETYKPCEEVVLSAKRIALTDLVVDVSNSLIKIDQEHNDTMVRVYEAPDRPNLVVEETTGQPVALVLSLPCNISNGTYFWQGAIQYEIHDTQKTYIYTTDLFNVENEVDTKSSPGITPSVSPKASSQPQSTTNSSSQTVNVIQQPSEQQSQPESGESGEINITIPTPQQNTSVIEGVKGTVNELFNSIL